MARTANQEVHSADTPPEQKASVIIDPKNRESDVIEAAPVDLKKDYLEQIAFNEEPVTIRIARLTGKNAAKTVPVWVNGKGCEVWDERLKRWLEITHVPVETVVITKRKYVAVLASAKQDSIETTGTDPEDVGKPHENRAERNTSALCSFTVIHDPAGRRGADWLTELLRRNF